MRSRLAVSVVIWWSPSSPIEDLLRNRSINSTHPCMLRLRSIQLTTHPPTLPTPSAPTERPPMNTRDPLPPALPDAAAGSIAAYAAAVWDDEIVPALTRYIAIPAKSPMFDAGLARARPHRARGRRGGGVGRVEEARRAEAGGGAARRAHAGDLLRAAGDEGRRQRGRRRHRAALRPPRQAARVHRLAQRPRPLVAEAGGRQALRPRRRRRRLRRLRRRHRADGARPPGAAAAALRRADRDLRGERQLRPAGDHRRARSPGSATSASSSASTRAPATTTSCGSPPACAGWSAAC